MQKVRGPFFLLQRQRKIDSPLSKGKTSEKSKKDLLCEKGQVPLVRPQRQSRIAKSRNIPLLAPVLLLFSSLLFSSLLFSFSLSFSFSFSFFSSSLFSPLSIPLLSSLFSSLLFSSSLLSSSLSSSPLLSSPLLSSPLSSLLLSSSLHLLRRKEK